MSTHAKDRTAPGVCRLEPGTPHRFFLGVDSLDDHETGAWLVFLDALAKPLGLDLELTVNRPVRQTVAWNRGSREPVIQFASQEDCDAQWSEDSVVTIGGSGALSEALLRRFRHFQIRCRGAPNQLHPSLRAHLAEVHWSLPTSGSNTAPVLDRLLEERPWRPRCTLITSMYDADRFVDAFFENCSALEGYERMEHFVVRPASPGKEHDAVCRHVEDHPGAVYLRLVEDPGLYAVWNQCCRLASAPYLSNANCDDRRAPDHVTALLDVLESNPDVDVASTTLRVTETENQRWNDSEQCAVWFEDEREGAYGVERLFRREEGRLVPRNLPHCMPVWRHGLHACNGDFDELRDGPSADWGFWLRAGAAGARFYLLKRPLGLYLQSQGSYWRRNPEQRRHDRHLTLLFSDLATGDGPIDPLVPRATEVRKLLAFRDARDWLPFFGLLRRLGRGAQQADTDTSSLTRLVDRLSQDHLGLSGAWLGVLETLPGPELPGTPKELSRLFWILVEALHREGGPGGPDRQRLGALSGALERLALMAPRAETMLALAFAASRRGEDAAERLWLEEAFRAEPDRFWLLIQAIYRFERPLDFFCEALEDAPRRARLDTFEAAAQLLFFPDYSHNNPYQKLIYEALRASGRSVRGIDSISALSSGALTISAGDVLHVHWVIKLFHDNPRDTWPAVIEEFLRQLEDLKRRGVRLWWTVHNRLSHDISEPELEASLRERLARLADRVLLHHPCLLRPLQEAWLPVDVSVEWMEHGRVPIEQSSHLTRAQARKSLGFEPEDVVILVSGLVRPYKDLPSIAPTIERVLARHDRLKLLVAGRLDCPQTRRWLEHLRGAQVTVHEGFVPTGDLPLYYRAASCVLLSYRDILTSGSLFQSLSFGVPVIGPALGSIPAYLVTGWSGFVYADAAELEECLDRIVELPAAAWQRLGDNAKATALTLAWPGEEPGRFEA